MRTDLIQGKKEWRWLLLIPAGILSMPPLLIAMLMGTRLLSIVAGPVNIWNSTWHVPPVADTAGYYGLSKTEWAGLKPNEGLVSRRSGFRLNPDHRVEVIDVPAFDGFGEPLNCNYNGTGDWRLDQGGGVTLTVSIRVSTPSPIGKPSCDPISLSLFQLLGHSPPYRFWYYIGDPDEETGLTYFRRIP